jgi:hypothetical protein
MQLVGDLGAASPTPSFKLATAEIAVGAHQHVEHLQQALVLHLLLRRIYSPPDRNLQ